MKSVLTAISIMIATFFFTQQATADIYKWVDKNGKMHFSNVPPTSGKKVGTIKTRNYPKPKPSQNSIILEPQVETTPPPGKVPQKKNNNKEKREQYASNSVIIYTTDW